jgi:hypothetical protein
MFLRYYDAVLSHYCLYFLHFCHVSSANPTV